MVHFFHSTSELKKTKTKKTPTIYGFESPISTLDVDGGIPSAIVV